MNTFELEGRVKIINEIMTFKNNFKKQEFIVTTFDSVHPQDIKFEAIGKNIDILEPIQEGDPIKVIFQIRGNEYQGKYFVNLQAKRLERTGKGPIDTNQKSEIVSSSEAFDGVSLDKLDETMGNQDSNIEESFAKEKNSNDNLDDELPF